MFNTFEMLMIDLLLILLITVFTEMLLDTKEYSKQSRSLVYTVSFALALFVNFIFTVQINGMFMMDLRHTVILIGGLYGGSLTLPILSAFAIGYIMVYSPDEAMANTIMVMIESIVIYILSKHYHKWRLRKKLAMTSCAVILVGYSGMKLIQYIFNYTTGYDFLIVSFYGASILILIYALEWVRNSIAIKKRIQRSEKLEIVSHLAASISHEIRNPLTVTKGFLQILENDDYPVDKKREFISLAKTELERAERIITDYLTFAKPASNKMEVLDVSREILHIIEVIHPLANMNSVLVHTSLNQEMKVKGERQLFHQCILNIVKNAIEAMEENGGTLTVQSQVKGNIGEIRISDTGVGMERKQIERLGEPYFSLKGKNGTGLGMMVVYSIVHSMNGKVFVESKPGQGTSFILHFPLLIEQEVPIGE
ncbi:hypothetical protein A8F94_15655 [Bacillus sp. FJAT-27225]|uniref:sensor histidine kinase n=1 Tax=Bacillus sp. FJAT-27225 TaxID=1743144 RepID=UPI00080C266A|nr:HAMP domain-containing sensor histidine kinase [Bacillus sp. FJAT-27225]OCA84156.1 hypothetical protein A8F94_15655 [Bacillus sp. FJAT-27225]